MSCHAIAQQLAEQLAETPPVCVCDQPAPPGVIGECSRCLRPHKPLFAGLRDQWRDRSGWARERRRGQRPRLKVTQLADVLTHVGCTNAADVHALTERDWEMARVTAGALPGRPMGYPSPRTQALVAQVFRDRSDAADPFADICEATR